MTDAEPGAAPRGEVRAAAANLLVVLADNKYWLGRHLSEWAVGAPSLEVAVACAAVAQGELGQARVLYPLLDELGFPGPADPLQRERAYRVSLLDRPFATWPHAVVGLALVDPALTVMLEALAGGAYEALARRVPRMLEEEAFHTDFAAGRVAELAGPLGGAAQLQALLDASLDEMLCWFGRHDEPGVTTLRGAGLLTRGNDELRQAYLDRVSPPLTAAGAVLPPARDRATGRWDHGDLPWERWNRLQRRLEPAGLTTSG
jgi:ring-1,2-phenylacetyl-CoA epoxidase subunit PaaC